MPQADYDFTSRPVPEKRPGGHTCKSSHSRPSPNEGTFVHVQYRDHKRPRNHAPSYKKRGEIDEVSSLYMTVLHTCVVTSDEFVETILRTK